MSEEEGAEVAELAAEDMAPTPRSTRGSKRIQQLTADLQAAHERIKLLEADTVTAERDRLAQDVKALEQKVDRMKGDHAAAAAQWQTSEAMLRRGLTDDEGQAVALALYARIPEEGRPELAAWMDGWSTDEGDQTPAALRPYLQRQAEPAAPPAAPLAGRQPAGSPGALGSVPASVRMAAARGDKDAQEAIRAYLAGRR